jgi:hypothetical protein
MDASIVKILNVIRPDRLTVVGKAGEEGTWVRAEAGTCDVTRTPNPSPPASAMQ